MVKNARREEGKKAKIKFCEANDKLDRANLDWSQMRMSNSWALRQDKKAYSLMVDLNSFTLILIFQLVFDSEKKRFFSSTIF